MYHSIEPTILTQSSALRASAYEESSPLMLPTDCQGELTNTPVSQAQIIRSPINQVYKHAHPSMSPNYVRTAYSTIVQRQCFFASEPTVWSQNLELEKNESLAPTLDYKNSDERNTGRESVPYHVLFADGQAYDSTYLSLEIGYSVNMFGHTFFQLLDFDGFAEHMGNSTNLALICMVGDIKRIELLQKQQLHEGQKLMITAGQLRSHVLFLEAFYQARCKLDISNLVTQMTKEYKFVLNDVVYPNARPHYIAVARGVAAIGVSLLSLQLINVETYGRMLFDVRQVYTTCMPIDLLLTSYVPIFATSCRRSPAIVGCYPKLRTAIDLLISRTEYFCCANSLFSVQETRLYGITHFNSLKRSKP